METVTSSPSTVGPPQAPRRRNGWLVLLDWGAVQPRIATSTRVCTHDRAGLGWSDPGLRPRAPAVAYIAHKPLAFKARTF
jgi:hypothetical protein